MLRYNGVTIGEVVIEQDICDEPRRFKIQIRQGNCLAVFIHVRKCTPDELAKDPKGKYMHTLYQFFADDQHCKNMLKEEGSVLFDKVVSIKLNMFYKECWKLLKYFTLSGYKVTCYYKKEGAK